MSECSSCCSVDVIGTRLADRERACWRCEWWGMARNGAFAHPAISARRVGKAQACPPLGRNAHRQRGVSLDKAGIDPLRFADHLDRVKSFQHLLPDDLELQFGQPHADAAVDAEAERQMRARA